MSTLSPQFTFENNPCGSLVCNIHCMTKVKQKSSKKKSVKKTSKVNSHQDQGRGLWKGAISFGLVNIPVRAISSKEQPDLHFTLLDPSNLSPIGYKYYNKATGEEVSHSDLIKGYKYGSGTYVLMSTADFKQANPKATQTIDIETFVDLTEIDPVFFERAYYLQPLNGAEKAYSLLCSALHKTGKVAIAKVVLHTKQHLVALVPRGSYLLLELLRFAEDVKELREIDSRFDAKKTKTQEVEMAEQLIDRMSGSWKPETYKNTYREDIMKTVKAKFRAGKATEITEETSDKKESDGAQVLDLMPLLRKSLAEEGKKSALKRKTARKSSRISSASRSHA